MQRSQELKPIGRIAEASNASFLCEIDGGLQVIYKPIRGELPLWDFPEGSLAARETAAYLVSESLGLGVVPPTILRDGPAGEGAVQLWIDHVGVHRAVDLVNASDEGLRRLALFDAIVNNGDRKGGHILPLPDGRILGVDHGVTFAVEPKLRTVLWAWRSKAFTDDERTVIAVLTHDPKFDVPALQVALRTNAGYIGAMGSRRTHEDRLVRLKEAGMTDAECERLHSPIGLDLGARTPEETAISIAAEIVQARWGGSGSRLAETRGPIHPGAPR